MNGTVSPSTSERAGPRSRPVFHPGDLVFVQNEDPTGWDIWLLPMTGDRKPMPYMRTDFDEQSAAISPDGRYVAALCLDDLSPEKAVCRVWDSVTGRLVLLSGPELDHRHRGPERERRDAAQKDCCRPICARVGAVQDRAHSKPMVQCRTWSQVLEAEHQQMRHEADAERRRNLLVTVSEADQPKHFNLALGGARRRRFRVRCSPSRRISALSCHCRRTDGLAV